MASQVMTEILITALWCYKAYAFSLKYIVYFVLLDVDLNCLNICAFGLVF